MTRDEAVTMVKQGLGFVTNRDTTIVSNMQFQQTQLELLPTKPWFLITTPQDLATVASQDYVALPTDYLQDYDEGGLFYYDSTAEPGYEYTGLEKEDYDLLRENYYGVVPGIPEAYAIVGDRMYLFPTPDAVYALKYIYFKKADLLATNVENEWLQHIPGLLIGKTGAQMAAGLRDFEAIKMFDRMTQEAMMILESQNEARMHAGKEMQMGGPA
jgi:hypothetical protein